MKIDPLILAEALSGSGERDEDKAHKRLFKEVESEARVTSLLWYIQNLSVKPGRLDEAVLNWAGQIKEDDDGDGYYYGYTEDFKKTLKFLCDGSGDYYHTGLFPLPFRDIIQKQMDSEATKVRATLADTKVSRLILKELDLASNHKVPVPIIGDSRFGKTKGMSVWCEMYPGSRRTVTVPDSNRDWDFFAAHADAFGLNYSHRTTLQQLKRSVEWVLQISRFFVCYDEAHYLVPVNYHADTPPKRINWIRAHVIDKSNGCAFFATPQSLNQTLEKYAAKTKYNLEQWIGRLAPPIVLADYYDRDELMAVAKVHFPKFPEKLLALICSRAMQSEGYLKSMEHAARYAAALAADRGHRCPTIQDVDESIARMMPTKAKVSDTNAGTSSTKDSLKAPSTPPLESVLDADDSHERTENFQRHRPGQVADSGRAMTPRARGELVTA